jgi:predicted lipoprotein with Yx(FWY)xxD motif
VALRRALLVGTACAGLAGCGSGDDNGERGGGGATSSATEASVTAEAPRRGPLVKLRRSQFGPVLFSGSDRALYLFTRDGRPKSRCYGECAAAWPPFHARGKPRAGDGVDASLLGTVERRDGRRQVTYRGQPLYFYVHDPKRQVLCNDVEEFGGTWFALDAAGEPPA